MRRVASVGRFYPKVHVLSAGILALALLPSCSAPPTPVPTQTAAPTATAVPGTAFRGAPVTSTFTVAPTPQPATATSQSTVQATASRTLTMTPQRVASSTPTVLLPAPQLIQPVTRASYSYKSPVILTWMWERSLGPGEYFEVQLSRDDAPPADLACTTGSTFQINAPPPLGYGWYQWRVLARRGQIQANGCTSQGDLTLPSETRTLEWRMPPEPTSPAYP